MSEISRATDYLRGIERQAGRVREVPAPAWTTYTPTVTAGTGTFTSVSATGKYTVIGKIGFVSVVVTITTNGTAAGGVVVTLPTGIVAEYRTGSVVGREQAVSGVQLTGYTSVPGTSLTIRKYDNTYPGGDGYVLTITAWFPLV